MTITNSEHGVKSQSESVTIVSAIDGELLRLVRRILEVEGQRIRIQRELIDYLAHHPDSQIPHVTWSRPVKWCKSASSC